MALERALQLRGAGRGRCNSASCARRSAPSGLEIAAWVRKLRRESCSLTPPGPAGGVGGGKHGLAANGYQRRVVRVGRVVFWEPSVRMGCDQANTITAVSALNKAERNSSPTDLVSRKDPPQNSRQILTAGMQ